MSLPGEPLEETKQRLEAEVADMKQQNDEFKQHLEADMKELKQQLDAEKEELKQDFEFEKEKLQADSESMKAEAAEFRKQGAAIQRSGEQMKKACEALEALSINIDGHSGHLEAKAFLHKKWLEARKSVEDARIKEVQVRAEYAARENKALVDVAKAQLELKNVEALEKILMNGMTPL